MKDTMIVVSPDYLEAIYKESQDMSFKIQGYGNFLDAIEGLMYVNKSHLLGCCLVSENLRKIKKTDLLKFLRKLELVSTTEDSLFLFALQNEQDLKSIDTKSFKGIKFMHISGIDLITDLSIRRDIFGTMLIENRKPYILSDKEELPTIERIPTLEYIPLFQPKVLEVLNKPDIYESLASTLSLDQFLKEMEFVDKNLHDIRELWIRIHFNCDIKEMITDLYKRFTEIEDSTVFCTYMGLLEIVRGVYERKLENKNS